MTTYLPLGEAIYIERDGYEIELCREMQKRTSIVYYTVWDGNSNHVCDGEFVGTSAAKAVSQALDQCKDMKKSV